MNGYWAFLPSVATFATTLLNNVKNLSTREFCMVVFITVVYTVTLWAQGRHISDLMMQHDRGFTYLKERYNERFELRELQRNFEVDIREVIEKDSEQFWFDVKPNVEKFGTYTALYNFAESKGLGRGGPRDVFDNVYREINETKESRHKAYQDKFRNHLHVLFKQETIRPGYKWGDARKLILEHESYKTLNEYVVGERLEHGRPRDIFEAVVEDLKEKGDEKGPKDDNTCHSNYATDDLYQFSNSKVYQSRRAETEENIKSEEIFIEKLRASSRFPSVLEKYYLYFSIAI